MSTYNLNIDTVNTSLDFYQAEKHIFGSSRLGMLKDSVNVLGSAYGNTDSSNVIHALGNKRYELSNHLGNVLTVISDKPIPHNNGGTVDYWEANISSAYDYSPFGVMLTGRTFEGKQTVCHDSTVNEVQFALQETFDTDNTWTSVNGATLVYSATYFSVPTILTVSNTSFSKKNIGAKKTFTTGAGAHDVSFVIPAMSCVNTVIWPYSSTQVPVKVSVKDNLGNVVTTGNYLTAGSYNLSFTPASAGATYTIEFLATNVNPISNFQLDDVLINFDDATTLTVCREVGDGYRYGFNGKEKDDEVKGIGSQLDYGMRFYDNRLGKFLSVDPLSTKYPMLTPYQFASNTPIQAIDLDGLEALVTINNIFLGYGTLGDNGTTRIATNYKIEKNSNTVYASTLANSSQTAVGRDGSMVSPTGITKLSDNDIGRILAYGTQVISNNDRYIAPTTMTAMEESVGNKANGNYGLLDFKFSAYDLLNIPGDNLLEINGTVYNANEAGNYLWAMVLVFNDVPIDPAWAADRKSVDAKGNHRPDEPHEQKAIKAGASFGRNINKGTRESYIKHSGNFLDRHFGNNKAASDVKNVIKKAVSSRNQLKQYINRKAPNQYSGNK